MKAQLIRIFAAVIALGVLLYSSACTTGTQTPAALSACKVQSDPNQAAAAILQKLTDAIDATALAEQRKADPTAARGTFVVEVQQAQGKQYFEAYIKGEVRGDDNLKILSNILNDFQDQDSCLRVVYFVESIIAPSVPSGFKWSSCEYPKYVCPNGECC